MAERLDSGLGGEPEAPEATEGALQLREDRIEAAAVHAVGGVLEPVAGLRLAADPLLHDLSENVAEAHGHPSRSRTAASPRGPSRIQS